METARQLRRYGPLGLIGLIAAGVGIAVVVGGGDDSASSDETGEPAAGGEPTTATGLVVETEWGEIRSLPEGVVPISVAEAEGLDIDWPETCDTNQGRLAVPSPAAPECFAPFDGDNGGATAPGVTEDTITVVIYESIEDDPIIDAIFGPISDDTAAEVTATTEAFLPYFHDFYETYGREVEPVVHRATGNAIDEVAARADARAIAEEIRPFAVWGGPLLTDAFADELAAQGILHLNGLGGAREPEYYAEQDPYLFQVGISPRQSRQHVSEYVGKRLAGDVAEHAGDPELALRERSFGLVFFEGGPESAGVLADFEDGLADFGVELTATASFQNPLDVSTEAPGIIARMKDAGVTSLLLTGDPLSPQTFTREATNQDYFPEWIVTGSPGVDTAAFGRTYDQDQWANAFGVSFGAARQDASVANADRLFRWYQCSAPPAPQGVELANILPTVFFTVLQGVGPDLTHEAFRDVLFAAPSTPRLVAADATPRLLTAASLSYGPPERGRWGEVDYQGVDDATEVWWDPDATGPDETGREAAGLYRYVDGGERFLPDEWPEAPPGAFQVDGSVTIYSEPPPGEEVIDYPSPCEP